MKQSIKIMRQLKMKQSIKIIVSCVIIQYLLNARTTNCGCIVYRTKYLVDYLGS